MAHTSVDYGTETPETIDRFGTEQEYDVRGQNGARKVRHTVTPVRAGDYEDRPTKLPRRFWWSVNRYTPRAALPDGYAYQSFGRSPRGRRRTVDRHARRRRDPRR